jgi:hypothetical protein
VPAEQGAIHDTDREDAAIDTVVAAVQTFA